MRQIERATERERGKEREPRIHVHRVQRQRRERRKRRFRRSLRRPSERSKSKRHGWR